jgi:Tfp pilus assembly protein PilV
VSRGVTIRTARLGDDGGFTIVDVLMAALLVVIGLLGVLKMLDTSNAIAGVAQSRSQANAIARSIIESARSLNYATLSSPLLVENTLKALPGLQDSDPTDTAWTIRQRNTTYTVKVFTLCAVDDQLDGFGDHTGGSYCVDSSIGTADSNPDDYKRLTIRLTWVDQQSASRSVRQTSLINNPGAGAGPSIRAGYAMTTPACGTPPANADTAPGNCRIVATTPTETDQATFSVTTAVPARIVNWLKANVFKANATAAASCSATTTCTSWSFVWSLGCLSQTDPNSVCFDSLGSRLPTTVDGAYLISAVAIDENNNAGPTRALTIAVNRRTPPANNTFIAGWNGAVVDFEWVASPDNDITRYKVFRVVGTPDPTPGSADDVAVCDVTSDVTSCRDSSPGAVGTSPVYYLAAYDLDDSGVERAGAGSNPYTAAPTNIAPTAPTTFACSPCTGVASFSWTASTDIDGTISFYRIYRTATAVAPTRADRYGRTIGPTPATFSDSDTAKVNYYWVSAVDNALAESAITGPVTAGG